MVIESWKHLMSILTSLTEEELKNAINYEVSTYKRKAVIERLHQRYNKLHCAREREMLINGEILL